MDIVVSLISGLVRAPEDVELGQRHGMTGDFQHEFLAFLKNHPAGPNAYLVGRYYAISPRNDSTWFPHAHVKYTRVLTCRSDVMCTWPMSKSVLLRSTSVGCLLFYPIIDGLHIYYDKLTKAGRVRRIVIRIV